ncbi:hypothetical protein ACROYT_G014333 [Oculina patagonica]
MDAVVQEILDSSNDPEVEHSHNAAALCEQLGGDGHRKGGRPWSSTANQGSCRRAMRMMKDLACEGSTVTIASGDVGEEYYFESTSDGSEKLKNESTDKWGNNFPPGAKVIHCKFYAAVDVDQGAYNLNEEKLAFVYAATIRNICCDLAIKQVRGKDIFYVSEEQHLDI